MASGLTEEERCWVEFGGWHYRIRVLLPRTKDETFLVERRMSHWSGGEVEKFGEARTVTHALELLKMKATFEQMYQLEEAVRGGG